ncbi:DUF1738 domain-containing protein [Shewanella sp. 202IG2-18]|uniref:ArdC family protein n=1 Tax=Parashewanella hymeniacidonis TaxID=2807618 RepID=UPI001961DEC6|nr:zincin-like metallopeptidase domain-containing protein [Parashewanella hymeniacidonis]MBM7072984.1 DUF1738 domain-containing protein [Parashewanella hymeniacidonis]
MADKKLPYHEQIANKLIEQLKAGTAPWQKPWQAGEPRMPHNPISGTRYKGSNAIWLAMQCREDPRWMTYKQAKGIDAQVQKGQHGTLVQYWKLFDQIDKKDDNGKKILGADGKPIKVTVKLDKPRVFSSVVFNAEQIEGLPELEVKTLPEWQRHERAEKILKNSGVPIHHDQIDNAYYCPATDDIHLPAKSQFNSRDSYFATVLHELSHSSGANHRLNRDMTGRFGDESYAKEELRAEIGSLMLGDELQIGHEFGQHAAYVDHWVKVLQDDPKEIIRASRDAEKIQDYLLELGRENNKYTFIELKRNNSTKSLDHVVEKTKVNDSSDNEI